MWPHYYSCKIIILIALALKLKATYIVVEIDAFLKLEPFFSYSVSKIVVEKKTYSLKLEFLFSVYLLDSSHEYVGSVSVGLCSWELMRRALKYFQTG